MRVDFLSTLDVYSFADIQKCERWLLTYWFLRNSNTGAYDRDSAHCQKSQKQQIVEGNSIDVTLSSLHSAPVWTC